MSARDISDHEEFAICYAIEIPTIGYARKRADLRLSTCDCIPPYNFVYNVIYMYIIYNSVINVCLYRFALDTHEYRDYKVRNDCKLFVHKRVVC